MLIKNRAGSLSIPLLIAIALSACASKAGEATTAPNISSAVTNSVTNHQVKQKAITVIADVHGDFPTMFKLLQKAAIINEQGHWIAGDRVLVSTGDLVDRGPDSRQILDFFMRLEQEAEQAGGAFKMALGNHEVMNIRGDLRYVSKAEFAAFADDEPAGLREQVYQDFLRYSDAKDNADSQKKFLKLYPPGFFGHVMAYAPEGKYGSWLLKKNIIIKFQAKLFTHGGFSQSLVNTGKNVEQLNQQLMSDLTEYSQLWRELIEAGLFKYYFSKYEQKDVAQALIDGKIKSRSLNKRSIKNRAKKFVQLSNSLLFDSFGPTWYRGNMYCHEFSEENTISNVLHHFNANQIFLGHTPDKSLKVRSRFNDKVIMLDTGMSQSYYKGNPSLVSITPDGLQVLNINDDSNQQPINNPVRKPLNANGFTDEYLHSYYSKAIVIEEKTLGSFFTRPTRLTFDLNGQKHRAIFKYFDTHPNLENKRWQKLGNKTDRYIFEMAAYKLDRLMGLNMVPFTMNYKHNGRNGALQYWVENSVSKTQLIEQNRKLKGFCTQKDSRNIMQIFDWLIRNEDRNTGNELYTEEDAQLWLIDHTRAFRIERSIFQNKRLKPPSKISDSFKAQLLMLNKDNLTAHLGDYLNKNHIRSILKRRNLILERLN